MAQADTKMTPLLTTEKHTDKVECILFPEEKKNARRQKYQIIFQLVAWWSMKRVHRLPSVCFNYAIVSAVTILIDWQRIASVASAD